MYEQKIDYEIDFFIDIDSNYSNNAKITIIDTLPYEINTDKEYNLNGGEYDNTNKTITWEGIYDISQNTITWNNGDIESFDKTTQIISKQFSLYYKDLSEDITNIVNNVNGIVLLDTNETKSVQNDFSHIVDFGLNIVIKKIWKNDIDIDQNGDEIISAERPNQITISICDENNNFVQDVILSNENNWEQTINDLPRYDENKNEIQYVIVERDVPMGYVSTIQKSTEKNVLNFNIINEKVIIFPETGGYGTICYMSIGSILLILCYIMINKIKFY